MLTSVSEHWSFSQTESRISFSVLLIRFQRISFHGWTYGTEPGKKPNLIPTLLSHVANSISFALLFTIWWIRVSANWMPFFDPLIITSKAFKYTWWPIKDRGSADTDLKSFLSFFSWEILFVSLSKFECLSRYYYFYQLYIHRIFRRLTVFSCPTSTWNLVHLHNCPSLFSSVIFCLSFELSWEMSHFKWPSENSNSPQIMSKNFERSNWLLKIAQRWSESSMSKCKIEKLFCQMYIFISENHYCPKTWVQVVTQSPKAYSLNLFNPFLTFFSKFTKTTFYRKTNFEGVPH